MKHSNCRPWIMPILSSIIGIGSVTPSSVAQVVIGAPRETQLSMTASPPPPAAGRPGSLSSIKSILGKQGPLAQWGPLALRPYTSYSITYGNGILRIPGEPVNSAHQRITQGLLCELGTTWTIDGAVTRSLYSNRLLDDSFDNRLHVAGRWTIDDLSFGVSQAYSTNSPIVVETGGQNEEETIRTSVDASYNLGDKTSIEASFSWSKRLADPKLANPSWTGSDWEQTSLSTWLNYQLTLRVNLSFGFMAGKDRLSLGDDMTYTQPQARIRWRPNDRISIAANGGIEKRKVAAAGARNESNPVYGLSVSYNPTLTTSVSFGVSRNVSTSYFNDATIRSTNWNAGINQRILQRFFLSLGTSYGDSKYLPTSNRIVIDRNDEYWSYNAGISTSFLRRGSVSITYSESENNSRASLFEYSSRQVSGEVSYRF